MSLIGGTCDERFAGVRAAFEREIESGEELGAAVHVDLDGEAVVDLWGGHRDAARTMPWERDTIVNVWSTTKTVTALCALVLVDRGQLDLDTPVAHYWPQFAQAGKDGVLVRHVLGHTSGVSGWEQPFAVEDLYDHDTAAARLAAQPPWWEPGTASGYHANTYGALIDELVRRTDGRTLRRFVADELAGPLDADLQIGARDQDRDRIAEIVPPPPGPIDLWSLPEDNLIRKTLTGSVTDASVANTDAWRQAEIGAVNAHADARSIAQVLSVIAREGERNGVRLLSTETIDAIFREQADGIDVGLGVAIRWGIGFALPKPELLPYVPDGRVCFWGGWGGSLAIIDLERRLTAVYLMNRMAGGVLGSDRSEVYVTSVYRALGVETRAGAG